MVAVTGIGAAMVVLHWFVVAVQVVPAWDKFVAAAVERTVAAVRLD